MIEYLLGEYVVLMYSVEKPMMNISQQKHFLIGVMGRSITKNLWQKTGRLTCFSNVRSILCIKNNIVRHSIG